MMALRVVNSLFNAEHCYINGVTMPGLSTTIGILHCEHVCVFIRYN